MTVKKWTIARRGVQLSVLLLIASPLFGLTVFRGNLSAGSLFGIGLADPLAFLQATLAGRVFVLSFFGSALLVLTGYFLSGGRSFCGWVCPVYLLTEMGDKLRPRFSAGGRRYPLTGNRWVLAATLVLSFLVGIPVFEVLSPIGIVSRAIMFNSLLPLLLLAAILVVEGLVARRLWCRSLCPLGGLYALAGRFSPTRVAIALERCTACGECLAVCPVAEVLEPALAGDTRRITGGDCTRCGACIDACAPRAMKMTFGYEK